MPNTAKNYAENGHYCLALLPTHYVITSTFHNARRQAIESFETEMTDAVSRMDGGISFIYTVDNMNRLGGRYKTTNQNIADATPACERFQFSTFLKIKIIASPKRVPS